MDHLLSKEKELRRVTKTFLFSFEGS